MKRAALALVLIMAVLLASASGIAQAKRGEKAEKAKDPVCGLMAIRTRAFR